MILNKERTKYLDRTGLIYKRLFCYCLQAETKQVDSGRTDGDNHCQESSCKQQSALSVLQM